METNDSSKVDQGKIVDASNDRKTDEDISSKQKIDEFLWGSEISKDEDDIQGRKKMIIFHCNEMAKKLRLPEEIKREYYAHQPDVYPDEVLKTFPLYDMELRLESMSYTYEFLQKRFNEGPMIQTKLDAFYEYLSDKLTFQVKDEELLEKVAQLKQDTDKLVKYQLGSLASEILNLSYRARYFEYIGKDDQSRISELMPGRSRMADDSLQRTAEKLSLNVPYPTKTLRRKFIKREKELKDDVNKNFFDNYSDDLSKTPVIFKLTDLNSETKFSLSNDKSAEKSELKTFKFTQIQESPAKETIDLTSSTPVFKLTNLSVEKESNSNLIDKPVFKLSEISLENRSPSPQTGKIEIGSKKEKSPKESEKDEKKKKEVKIVDKAVEKAQNRLKDKEFGAEKKKNTWWG